MKLSELFEIDKKITIDLSHLIGKELQDKYEVLQDIKMKYLTNLDSDIDNLNIIYFEDANEVSKNGMLIQSDAQFFYTTCHVSEEIDDSEVFKDVVEKISSGEDLTITVDNNDMVFSPITYTGGVVTGIEYNIETGDSDINGTKNDAMYRLYQAGEELAIVTMISGELLIHVGVEIKEGEILY